jgi:aerobic-type carbon monoxide dehydrogenase small subunit (CoxS/CutS family)
LAGLKEGDKPSRLQQAFMDEQAAQCGYCTSGMIIQAQALLDRNPKPTESDVRAALDGNLCRCGAHNRVVRAVLRAAKGA